MRCASIIRSLLAMIWMPFVMHPSFGPEAHGAKAVDPQWANQAEHWMAQTFAGAPDTRLCDIVIPGSHDSGANRDVPVSSTRFALGSRTQDKSLSDQLRWGARYLDLRTMWDGTDFLVHHNEQVYGRTAHALDAIAAWATAHPKEIVIVHFLDLIEPVPGSRIGSIPGVWSSKRNVWDSRVLAAFHALIKEKIGAHILPRAHHGDTIHAIWGMKGKNLLVYVPRHAQNQALGLTYRRIHGRWPRTPSSAKAEEVSEAALRRRDPSDLFLSKLITTPVLPHRPAMRGAKQWTTRMIDQEALCPNIVIVDWFPHQREFSLVDLTRRGRCTKNATSTR